MVLAAAAGKDVLSFGPFRLAAGERLLTSEGAPVELGARALEILIALVSTPNEVISKKDLLSHVWPDVTVEESTLRFHMASLRKTLGDGKDGARYITTVAGRGYCFVTPVSRSRNESEAAAAVTADFRHANLPSRLAGLIDREDDLQKVAARLEEGRFVTVVGVDGVGKTTVAIALGHHLIEASPGAVLFVCTNVIGGRNTQSSRSTIRPVANRKRCSFRQTSELRRCTCIGQTTRRVRAMRNELSNPECE